MEEDIKWIHQEIDKIKNPQTIKKLKNLLESIHYPNIDSVNSYNLDLENSIKAIKDGKFYTEDQARERIFSKYNTL
ncbi:hypothetical protein [Flavobacterium foetidum]|uniref:hypothetical protein n=1 Tax=Flavobacterium foetidum TaxID=2026681 RepID=UPI001FC962F9|nr:hypothetical protein [Flavobacterium foetidum]